MIMEAEILDNIPFGLDLDKLIKKLRIKEGSSDVERLESLAEEAMAIGRPKALYKAAYIETRGQDSVVINGFTFTSRVLQVNLEEAHRVFFYLATCGTELEDWSKSLDDLLYQYWADNIKEMCLRAATSTLHRHLKDRFQLKKTATMSPGSLEDWPITEQRPFFDLIGDLNEEIGVQLTDSFLMLPVKSISGIRFPTETHFESCQLCSRKNCPGRRAHYDKDLYDSRFV